MLFVSSHSWTHWYHLGLSLNDLSLRTITETMLSQFLLRYEMSTSCLKDQLIPKSPVPSTKGTIVPIATLLQSYAVTDLEMAAISVKQSRSVLTY